MLTKIVLLNCAKYEQGIITINDEYYCILNT